MSNMSYCRFQNTLEDLKECLDAMDEGEIAESEEEYEARKELLNLCNWIYQQHKHLRSEEYKEEDSI